jgi:tetratricopeptide (TPR) repeat protein
MIGVTRRELEYWTRLRLVLPQSRWGERFFNFSDLVALDTIKRLASRRVPARRIRRAILALEMGMGGTASPLSKMCISTNGKEVVVHPPTKMSQPFEPLTGQFVLNFDTSGLAKKIHTMASRSAEEWFELGMLWDSKPDSLDQATAAYFKAVKAAPEWVEAHINLGTCLYQLNHMREACIEFETAVALEPGHALAEFNLGSTLEQAGETQNAINHLLRAVEIAPDLADAHINLALIYEKLGQAHESLRHLALYLRHDPHGPWAAFARERISRHRQGPGPSYSPGKVTPFRRPR